MTEKLMMKLIGILFAVSLLFGGWAYASIKDDITSNTQKYGKILENQHRIDTKLEVLIERNQNMDTQIIEKITNLREDVDELQRRN